MLDRNARTGTALKGGLGSSHKAMSLASEAVMRPKSSKKWGKCRGCEGLWLSVVRPRKREPIGE